MTKWVHRLSLKDLWEAKDKNEITLQELSKKVAERIKSASFYKKYEDDLEPIVDEFEGLSEDAGLDNNDVTYFDNILSNLYDWADQEMDNLTSTPFHKRRKMCWIETSF